MRGLAPALLLSLLAPGAAVPGCSFESAPVTGESRVAPSPVTGGAGESGGPPAGSDPTPVGGGASGAIPVAGTGARPGAAGGGGSQPDAAVDNPLPMVPAGPGALFSGCVLDRGCDEDLTCYGDRMGFCTESCEVDGDCTDHGGVDFTCSDQQCRVDCGASGTDGECPAPLVCTPQLFFGERCLLPRE